MAKSSYGTVTVVDGDTEHLGNLSIGDIKSIFVRSHGTPEYRLLDGDEAREFWQLNSGEVVYWSRVYECWCGLAGGKFGTLRVTMRG